MPKKQKAAATKPSSPRKETGGKPASKGPTASQHATDNEDQNQEAIRRWKNEGGSRNDSDND